MVLLRIALLAELRPEQESLLQLILILLKYDHFDRIHADLSFGSEYLQGLHFLTEVVEIILQLPEAYPIQDVYSKIKSLAFQSFVFPFVKALPVRAVVV